MKRITDAIEEILNKQIANEMNSIKINIYTLKDPITNMVRYVGITSKPINIRLSNHVSNAKCTNKNNKTIAWIRSLMNKNKIPIVELIETVPIEEKGMWEKYWIAQFKCWGFNLTNHTEGGEGIIGYRHTEKSRKIMSIKRKGVKHSKQHTENLKKAFIKRGGFTQEQIEKGRKKSLLVCLGSKHTKEHCRKISEGNKGKHAQTPEDIERTKNIHYKPILQYDLEGNFIREWKGAMEITREYGFHNGVIGRYCKGLSDCGYGFIWKYK